MGFWDAASQGMNTGVQLGVRMAEREQDRQARKEEQEANRAERQDRFAQEMVLKEDEAQRQSIKFARETKDYDEKKAYESAKKTYQAAQNLYDAGDEVGSLQQIRGIFDNKIPNGMKGQFIRRADIADD